MKKNILTIIIMASCLLNLILTAVIVFAVVPTMNKTSQLVDKVATAIDLETDEEASGDYSIDNLEPYSIAFENKQTINLKPDEGDNTSHFAVLEGVTISFNKEAEDYKEVSERYEFLKGQHDDLIVARDRLIGVINELDTGMRERFTEKFAEIKIEFDKVFKQLFGGGKGSIELDEDADILEANITIISQPPGKKLQNMMQLSGGEKALTAICLLFAIQNLKPSPFCLLDEIEAALDDSNVDRFAKYLHNLTKNTQFIVITHRRGTMASADRLYGITMQEKGVSTLVSVDLIAGKLDDGNNQI